MGLKIDRVSVGEPKTEKALGYALRRLDCPRGEQWTLRLSAAPRSAWELVLDGPPRRRSRDAGWQAQSRNGSGFSYRRLLRGDEQRAEYVESLARQLLWESIQFAHNPLWGHDPRLGRAFEEAVWSILREQASEPLEVRFNLWRGAPGRVSYVCKVESAATGTASPLPWRWWSSLVETPDELSSELEQAVRRRRQALAPAASFPSARDLGPALPC